MKIKQGKPFIILTSENIHKIVSKLIDHKLKFKYVAGNYNGVSEVSVLVAVNDDGDVEFLRLLANQHKQESILYVDHNRDAKLLLTPEHKLYRDVVDHSIGLGKFVRALPDVALERDNWTKDISTSQYWITDLAA